MPRFVHMVPQNNWGSVNKGGTFESFLGNIVFNTGLLSGARMFIGKTYEQTPESLNLCFFPLWVMWPGKSYEKYFRKWNN